MSRKLKITGKEESFAESLQNCLGEMLVLFLLKQKPMYTYEIMQEISRISNGSFSYKSLYPYIYRLKNAGCIDEESTAVANNRTRIYFHITESGREHLVKIKRKYREITTAANLMLDLDEMIYISLQIKSQ
ncbi:MAG: PadR family transcriptional regulator [Lachnospiraceae bacterium]|jgi:PadR family transcriptional regulator PadR|nr:PadR family transcriptional regulator [Lachnospiraceae bacterium]